MDFTLACALHTLFLLLNKMAQNVIKYNLQYSDFPLAPERVEQYVTKQLFVSIIWTFSGDTKLNLWTEIGFLCKQTGIDLSLMNSESSLIDFDVQITTSDWIPWQSKMPSIEVNAHHAVMSSGIVVPMMDTGHKVLYSWLSEHKPLMLCGPLGSGKTMTLFSTLRKLPNMEVIGLQNFSSATTPELILKTFEQYCEYRKSEQREWIMVAVVNVGAIQVVPHKIGAYFSLNLSQCR
jgi:dynein heavy chain 1